MSEELQPMISGGDLEGRVLGEYRLEKLVGKGGMAWVYRATHTKFEEQMAVKILLPHLSGDEDLRSRFLEEAKIQFKMRHAHIIQVTDIVEDGRLYGFVMEWAEGKNLKQVLGQLEDAVSRKDMWRIMGPILDAVGYAHQQGLVHRDIKPANILLHQEDGVIIPKIADFGIAKALDDESGKTQTGMTMGTLKYMPPEQIRDAKRVDHRADIYALGVTLYMMAALRLPFEGRQEFVIYQQMNEDPPPPSAFNPKLSAAIDRVILKSLAKTPEERFQSCAEFGHALSLALIDPDSIKSSPNDLDTHKIYNLLEALPEENSIYQTSLTPLSPILVQELYRSNNSDSITQLTKFVLEGDPEFDTKSQKLKETMQGADLSQEEFESETVLHSNSLAPTASQGGKSNTLPIVLGLVIALLLGGGGVAFFMMSKKDTKPAPRPDHRPIASTAECKSGETRPCYTGKASTKGKGLCKSGQQSCVGGKWQTACKGQILPKEESCDGKDNDCNGKVDDGKLAKVGETCSSKEGDCSFPGKWQCKAAKLRCEAAAGAKAPGMVRVRIRPSGRAFRFRYKSKNGKVDRTVKGRTCMSIAGRGSRLRVSARGYVTCIFYVSKRQRRPLKLVMDRSGGILPPPHYCKKR